MAREEAKLASHQGYRTSPATLRKLAAGPMIFESDQTKAGDWDRFQLRNIGMAVQRRMADRFSGDAGQMREQTTARVSATLGIRPAKLKPAVERALSDFAVALSMGDNVGSWNREEKHLLKEIIEAKAGVAESRYLKLMQRHPRLRRALIRLGS